MNDKRKKDKSKFVSYCVGCVAILMTLCACFVFLYFQTDIIMDVDTAINHKVVDFERTTVYTHLQAVTPTDGTGGGAEHIPGLSVAPGIIPPSNAGGGSGNSNGVNWNPTQVTVSDTKKQVYNAFKSWGYSDSMIAGIFGNIEAESGFRYYAVQGDNGNNLTKSGGTHYSCEKNANCTSGGTGNAHGLVQWDGSRRAELIKAAVAAGIHWTDGNLQLQYLKDELEGNYYGKWCSPSTMLNGCESIGDVNDTALAVEYSCYRWCRFFEVCSGVTSSSTYESRTKFSHWDTRIKAAQGYYDAIKKGDFK